MDNAAGPRLVQDPPMVNVVRNGAGVASRQCTAALAAWEPSLELEHAEEQQRIRQFLLQRAYEMSRLGPSSLKPIMG